MAIKTRINENNEYWCPSCKKYLPKDKFHSNKSRKFGIDSLCASCINERKRKIRHAAIVGSGSAKKTIKLEFMERGNIKNFTYYFSQRKYHFKEIFQLDFTPENAKKAFVGIFLN